MSISGNQTAPANAQNDVLKKILTALAASSPTRPFRAPVGGDDGSVTDAPCRSLAGRIVTALCGGSNVVLVIGDPLPNPVILSQALNQAVAWWYAPTVIACQPELSRDQLLHVASRRAIPEESGSVTGKGEAAPAPLPLYVFDDADRLSDAQIENISEALAPRDRTTAAGVFLAHPNFLTRLERSGARLLKERKITQITWQEFHRKEPDTYVRHQPRPKEAPPPAEPIARGSYRHTIWRLSIGVLLCLAVCGFLLVPGDDVSSLARRAEQRMAALGLPDFAAWTRGDASLPTRPLPTHRAAPEGDPSGPSAAVQSLSSVAGIAASAETPEQTTIAPIEAPVERHLSAAEIGTLVARGDAFVSMRDLVSARLYYVRAVEAGDRGAALRMGATFDPAFLDRAGIRGEPGNQPEAFSWYRLALTLGNGEAERPPKESEPPSN
jgi:hypothetical protein